MVLGFLLVLVLPALAVPDGGANTTCALGGGACTPLELGPVLLQTSANPGRMRAAIDGRGSEAAFAPGASAGVVQETKQGTKGFATSRAVSLLNNTEMAVVNTEIEPMTCILVASLTVSVLQAIVKIGTSAVAYYYQTQIVAAVKASLQKISEKIAEFQTLIEDSTTAVEEVLSLAEAVRDEPTSKLQPLAMYLLGSRAYSSTSENDVRMSFQPLMDEVKEVEDASSRPPSPMTDSGSADWETHFAVGTQAAVTLGRTIKKMVPKIDDPSSVKGLFEGAEGAIVGDVLPTLLTGLQVEGFSLVTKTFSLFLDIKSLITTNSDCKASLEQWQTLNTLNEMDVEYSICVSNRKIKGFGTQLENLADINVKYFEGGEKEHAMLKALENAGRSLMKKTQARDTNCQKKMERISALEAWIQPPLTKLWNNDGPAVPGQLKVQSTTESVAIVSGGKMDVAKGLAKHVTPLVGNSKTCETNLAFEFARDAESPITNILYTFQEARFFNHDTSCEGGWLFAEKSLQSKLYSKIPLLPKYWNKYPDGVIPTQPCIAQFGLTEDTLASADYFAVPTVNDVQYAQYAEEVRAAWLEDMDNSQAKPIEEEIPGAGIRRSVRPKNFYDCNSDSAFAVSMFYTRRAGAPIVKVELADPSEKLTPPWFRVPGIVRGGTGFDGTKTSTLCLKSKKGPQLKFLKDFSLPGVPDKAILKSALMKRFEQWRQDYIASASVARTGEMHIS